jgi:hypothetical protein
MDKHSIVNWLLEDNLVEADKYLEEARRIDKEIDKKYKEVNKELLKNPRYKGDDFHGDKNFQDAFNKKYISDNEVSKKSITFKKVKVQKHIKGTTPEWYRNTTKLTDKLKEIRTSMEEMLKKDKYSNISDILNKAVDNLSVIDNVILSYIPKNSSNEIHDIISKYSEPLYDLVNGLSDEGYEDQPNSFDRIMFRKDKALNKMLTDALVSVDYGSVEKSIVTALKNGEAPDHLIPVLSRLLIMYIKICVKLVKYFKVNYVMNNMED